MSDDDFGNLDFDSLDDSSAEEDSDDDNDNDDNNEDEDDGSESGNDDGTGTGNNDDGKSGDDDGDSDDGSDGSGSTGTDESGDKSGSGDSSSDDADNEGGDTDDSETESESVSESEPLNYKAEHEKLLAPFRANNKDMQVDNVEDARTLMQMGANYNKKMAGLKPNLKLIKMLDNNDLLSEDKLSFLIDLSKNNPDAIQKLLKDSGVNPLEIDLESDNEYKSDTYTVNDNEVELDGILEDIKDTKSFSETIDIISNKWDESSKQILLEQPSVIKTINEHVASGVYAQIQEVLERKRMLGQFQGVSDLEAYQQVGNEINAADGFNRSDTSNVSTNTTTDKKPETKTVDSKQRRSRKKAASSTKTNAGSKGAQDFNPLSMSDEDFENASVDKFL